jgi:hypothetical protein
MNEIGCHIGHCCKYHGCKYNDPDCPVSTGKVEQEDICYWCYEDGIEDMGALERAIALEKESQSKQIQYSLEEIEEAILKHDSDGCDHSEDDSNYKERRSIWMAVKDYLHKKKAVDS